MSLEPLSGHTPFDVSAAIEGLKTDGAFLYQVPANDLQKYQHGLLNAHRLKFTLPLIAEDARGRRTLLGTGTLFKHEGRCFLITADHILRRDENNSSSPLMRMEDVAVPDAPRSSAGGQPADLITLGSITSYRLPLPVSADVIVVELHDQVVIDTLSQGWAFMPLSETDALLPTDDRFVIAGFLGQGLRFENGVISQAMLNLETDYHHTVPSVKEPAPGLDLFFYLQRDCITVDGEPRRVDSLRGLSGGSIWALREVPSGDLWEPSKAMKIVAIQSTEFQHREQWARGVNWDAVRSILRSAQVGFVSPP